MDISNDRWWLRCSLIKRYMPGEDGMSMARIAAELETVAAQGYGAIQITAPYASAGFWPWWGLRPRDHFGVNAILDGDMAGFRNLVQQCHVWGLKVMVFLNLGYADTQSPLWQKACADKRSCTDSPESRYFLWREPGENIAIREGNQHFRQQGGWHWSPEAQSEYWYHWYSEYHGLWEPQYNWASPEFRDYARRVLIHWLDTGIDGVIVDAANWYLNCDWQTIRSCVTDVVHRYPGVMCIPEGGTGFGDDYLPWITRGGFDVIEDQAFLSNWQKPDVHSAIDTADPEEIEICLRVCRAARERGIPVWSYLSWDEKMPPQRRLMEIGLLLATGHMTEIIPSHLMGFEARHWDRFYRLLRAGSQASMVPIVPRRRIELRTGKCYGVICDETVLCIFGLLDAEQTVSVDMRRNCLADGTWADQLSGTEYTVADGLLHLTIPPMGFVWLECRCE